MEHGTTGVPDGTELSALKFKNPFSVEVKHRFHQGIESFQQMNISINTTAI